MSNKPFDEKKVFYGQSNFYYTRLLAGHSGWQVSDIEARSRELVRAALKVWTLPPEYQSSIVLSSSLHRLGEDEYQFIRTRPAMLLVGDSENGVSNWSELVTTVLKTLDDEDHDAFVEACNSGVTSLVRAGQPWLTSNAYVALDNEVGVNNKLPTPVRLAGLSAVVSLFDGLAGTNYSDCIMFQLS